MNMNLPVNFQPSKELILLALQNLFGDAYDFSDLQVLQEEGGSDVILSGVKFSLKGNYDPQMIAGVEPDQFSGFDELIDRVD
jgi:hypothetical protein